jgi:hypothetical protein
MFSGAPCTDMLSEPIDLRLYLTDAEFRGRVLRSKAWREYLALPPIPPFDETGALAEIAQRNAIRSAHQLPLLDADQDCEVKAALRVQDLR